MDAPVLRIGRYELLERIGHGTLGVLYFGRDTLLGREVAVKVMASGLLGDVEARNRFFREAKAAARLQHVNIVTIFEFGDHDDTPYIVMEFLRGHSLAERLHQDPPLSLRDKLDVAIQLSAGLEAAHTQGVVHRDVKPGNIWMCQDGTVKLLDFGIATAASSSATFDVLGSPGYISPEQVAGTEIDSRTDIFSAGVVLYEMLSGRRPFEADSPTGVMLKIVNEAADPIGDPDLPPALTATVMRALEKSPAARYPRASDLGRALKAVRADLPMAPEPPTVLLDRTVLTHTAPPSPPPAPRGADGLRVQLLAVVEELRRLWAGLPPIAAIVLLGVLSVGALTWFFWPTASSEPRSTAGVKPKTRGTDPTPPPSSSGGDPAGKNGGAAPVTNSVVALRLNSRPSAAKILIDGRDSGKVTPAEIPIDTSRPSARIQLEMNGFKTEDVSVTADALRNGTIDVPLVPREAVPRVVLVASGDYAFDVMDRQRVLSAARERHDVVVSGLRSVQLRSSRFFLDQSVRIDRADGGTVTASVPPLGSISVYASGVLEDCKVYIDERIVDSGSFPVANREISSGTHRVKLVCSRGETDPQTVTVLPHQNASTRFPASTPMRPR
jgi:serine/threonine protein kinase